MTIEKVEVSMRYLSIFLALAIVACGQKNDGDHDSPVAEESPAPAKPALQSLAIATLADLPACSVDNSQQLIYVVEAKQFKTCQDGSWQTITIEGDPGPKGDPGKSPTATAWTDPMTNQEWAVASVTTSVAFVCETGWAIPTQSQLQEAIDHGIGTALATTIASDSRYQCAFYHPATSVGELPLKLGATCDWLSTPAVNLCRKS